MKLKLNLPLKILIILITLLIVLNALDILLTGAILYYGGEETNTEIVFWLFGVKIGPYNLWGHLNTVGIRPIDYVVKIGATFLMGGIMLILYWFSLRKNSKFAFITTYVLLIGLNIFYSYVVVHNIQILVAQKQIWESWQHISNIR